MLRPCLHITRRTVSRVSVSGNIAKVKELIKVQSMLIAKPNDYGVPPLSAACAVGRLDVASEILFLELNIKQLESL